MEDSDLYPACVAAGGIVFSLHLEDDGPHDLARFGSLMRRACPAGTHVVTANFTLVRKFL